MDDNVAPSPANGFADQAMVVSLAIARGRIEKIDAEIERTPYRRDGFAIVSRAVDARHAIASEPNARHVEIGVTKPVIRYHAEYPLDDC
jgi:hypothetical protein